MNLKVLPYVLAFDAAMLAPPLALHFVKKQIQKPAPKPHSYLRPDQIPATIRVKSIRG